MDEVDEVAGACEGVGGPQVGGQGADFLHREVLDFVEIGLEEGLHLLVRLVCAGGNQGRGDFLGDDFSTLDFEFDFAVAHVAGGVAGVNEGEAPVAVGHRPVVVGTDEEVHAFQGIVEVEALALQDGPVAAAGAGMDGDDDDLGLEFPGIAVDVLLDERNERKEVHAAPEGLVQPGFHVGVGIAEDEHLQPVFPEQGIRLEIGLAVVRADGVAGEEGDPRFPEIAGDAVVDRVAGFDVVVADRDGVIPHVSREARIEVGFLRIDVVVIVGGVVALEAVSRVDEQDVFSPGGAADAVHVVLDGEKGRARGTRHVVFVEPAAVDVVGREEAQVIGPVFRAAGAEKERGGKHQGSSSFHLFRRMLSLQI